MSDFITTSSPSDSIQSWSINAHLIELNCGRGIVVEDFEDTLVFDGEKYYLTNLGFELTKYKTVSVIDIGLGITVTEIDFAGSTISGEKITEGILAFTSGEEPFVLGMLVHRNGDNGCFISWTLGGPSN